MLRGIAGIIVLVLAAWSIEAAVVVYFQQGKSAALTEVNALTIQVSDLNLKMDELSQSSTEPSLPSRLVWEALDQGDAELKFQHMILDLATQHGLNLRSFGPVLAPSGVISRTTAFAMEGNAGYSDILGFIGALEHNDPAIIFHSIWLRLASQSDSARPETLIDFRFTLWGFWENGVAQK